MYGQAEATARISYLPWDKVLQKPDSIGIPIPGGKIWLEDESCNLGKCRIPNCLYTKMKKAPILEIIKTKDERIDNLVNIFLGKMYLPITALFEGALVIDGFSITSLIK